MPSTVISFTEEGLFSGYTELYFLKLKTMKLLNIHKFSHFATKICSEGTNCCVLLSNNQINIYKNYQFVFSLPVLERLITALTFGFHKNIYLITEDNILHGYNIKTQQPEKYTSQYSYRFPKTFLNEVNRTVQISKFGANSLILNTHYSFTIIDLTKRPPKNCEVLAKDMFPEHKYT